MTGQKSRGKRFPEVLLNVKGVYGKTATRPGIMSLYVRLSRAEVGRAVPLPETGTRRFY